jgi:hypothetical protein
MIYLCNDILECIYLKIDNKRTQINMVKTSRYLYKKYYDDLVKMYIYRTLTNKSIGYYDNSNGYYPLFYKYIKRFSYNQYVLDNLLELYLKKNCSDLRFIFELLYKGARIDNKLLVKLNERMATVYYPRIKRCIIRGNRKKTMVNLNNDPVLLQLHTGFVPNNINNPPPLAE